jgi:hypothetical protein
MNVWFAGALAKNNAKNLYRIKNYNNYRKKWIKEKEKFRFFKNPYCCGLNNYIK